MMRFTLPRDMYYGKGALEELKNIKGEKAVLVLGGGSMKRFGFVDQALEYLKEAGIETKLFERLEPHYKNNKKEGRKLLAATFRTAGSLKLAPGKIIITLEPQSSPARTKAINGLTADLNKMNAKFPGSARVIQFEPTPISEK